MQKHILIVKLLFIVTFHEECLSNNLFRLFAAFFIVIYYK